MFQLSALHEGIVKETLRTINRLVVIGGVAVQPGDMVGADDDGVMVATSAAVVKIAVAHEEKEAESSRHSWTVVIFSSFPEAKQVLSANNCTSD